MWAAYALAVTCGLMFGSYLGTGAFRWGEGKSNVGPPSHCPACGHRLGPADLVPVLSFLFLRGRCRYCSAPIGWYYPAVELLSGVLWFVSLWRFGLDVQTALAVAFGSLLLVVGIIDIQHRLIPDRLSAVLGLLGIATGGLGLSPAGSLTGSLLGAATGGGILLIVHGLVPRGMGLGDVKLLAAIGAFLGWQGALITLFLGAALGAVTGLLLLARRRASWKTAVPFGPFLAVAAFAQYLAGWSWFWPR